MTQPPQPTQYLGDERHADGKKSAFQKTTLRSSLTALHAAQPQSIYLRDGELVLYRRSRSLLYQCRYRLADGTWVRQTTGNRLPISQIGSSPQTRFDWRSWHRQLFSSVPFQLQ